MALSGVRSSWLDAIKGDVAFAIARYPLRRGGQRRVLAGAGIAEPLFPFGGVVRPLLHLDAPWRRLGGQIEFVALHNGEAAWYDDLGVRLRHLGIGKYLPQPRRLVR